MSASREKKARQSQADVISEKKLKAQQEAAQAKRSKIMYTVIGVVCAVAAAALLIWNSGIFAGKNLAVNVDGKDYSAAEVQYYYNGLLNQYYTYAQYGMDVGFDPTSDPAEQMYDEANGITWRDQLLDEAVTTLVQTKVLVAQAEAEGVELSEDGAHEIAHAVEDLEVAAARNNYLSVNSYLKALYGQGMDKALYKQLANEGQLAYEYQAAYAENLTYTDEELEAYYAANKDDLDLYDYNYAIIEIAEDETKSQDDLLKDAKQKAEAIQTELNSGADFMAAVGEDEHVEDSEEHVHTPAGEERGASIGYVNPSYAEWLQSAERKAGDVTVVEDTEGVCYYVVQFVSRGRNEEVAGDVRHILVAAEQDEGATAPTEEQYAAAKTKAEELLAQWKAGEGANEETFATLAFTESADPGSASNGGLYENVSSQSGFIADFANWATDPNRKPGDTGLVQNTQSSTKGWHIMYFVGQGDSVWKTDARSGKVSEDANAWLDGLVEAAQVTRLDGIADIR